MQIYYQGKGDRGLSEQEIEKEIVQMGQRMNRSLELGQQLNKLAWPNVPHDLTKIEELLKVGANPNINVDDELQECLLHKLACHDKYNRLLELLLRYEANPHQENFRSCTPLHNAAWWGAVKNTILLLDAKAKVNICNKYKETPLHYLLKAMSTIQPNHYLHYLETAQALIDRGADLQNMKDLAGKTAIEKAIKLARHPRKINEFDSLFRRKLAQDLFTKLQSLTTTTSYLSRLPLDLLKVIPLFVTDEEYRTKKYTGGSFCGDV